MGSDRCADFFFELYLCPLIVLRTLVLGADLPGYASLIVAILFLGGIQLIGIGVLGEYIGRIYVDVKRRPHYFVRAVHKLSLIHI